MKSFTIIFFFSLTAIPLTTAQQNVTPEGYTNFITKTLLADESVESYAASDILPSGSMPGQLLEKTHLGITYKLYSIKFFGGSLVGGAPIAKTTIGLFVPRAEMVISTKDPWNSNRPTLPRRTRADMPFTVAITPSGLEAVVGKPDCFRQVDVRRTSQSYGYSDLIPVPNPNPIVPGGIETLSQNGLVAHRYALNIPIPAGQTSPRGSETFSVWTLQDQQLTNQETILPKELVKRELQVWPVTTGKHLPYPGEGKPFRGVVPNIQFVAYDLYPTSDTFLEYYQGPYVKGKTGLPLSNGEKKNTIDNSIGFFFTATELTSLLNEDGEWTIVLRTQVTNFGPDDKKDLDHTSPIIKRTLSVNTTLTTSE